MKTNTTNTATNWRKFLKEQNAEIAAVAKVVISQLGGYWPDSLNDLDNVAASPCGAAGGFSGFVYYTETVAFWRKHRAKITRLMAYQPEAIGYANTLDMVANFNSVRNAAEFTADEIARALYGRFDDNLTYIYNIFAWYALEEVAYFWNEYKYNLE